ncbi:MAG TPA: DUF1501 domain-containing protein [Planctomycetaceae bacterium]|nr:DUF1501 domain-containing protein [Planctomycetaceae bacterium]
MPEARPVCCADFSRSRLSRRSLLRVGGLGLAGVSLADLLRAEAGGATRHATAKSVILLFQFGGPSQLETFDPKPDAPDGIRGEFKAVPTSVPGRLITEHLPQLAKLADKYALVRSVHHRSSSHNPGAYVALTGREPLVNIVTLNASATDFPHPGSVVDHLDRTPRDVPAFVSLPTMIADGPFRTPGEFAGFLGKQHDPLWVLKDPNDPGFNVSELRLPDGIDVDRLADRRETLETLRELSQLTERTADVAGMNEYQAKAMALVTSAATQRAFAIDQEPDEVRERYGRHQYGQSVLLARRLVEAGVRFVTVYYSRGISGWDTHENNFSTLKNSRLPQTDQALSALLTDLGDRGLLGETLVYWTGDFGRTPKINRNAGRDHWPPCGTVLMAGGGLQGGREYGSSDAHAAYPHDNPTTPADITATVFHALGFDPETLIRDQLNRPMPISEGRPIGELF